MSKTYSELITFPTFRERFDYLKIVGCVGESTFGGHRELNQQLYRSEEWKRIRREIMIRDNGMEFGLEGYPINGMILIHHINPITIYDILHHHDCVYDPENLISMSFQVHNAVHYGSFDLIQKDPIVRTENDTCPWR